MSEITGYYGLIQFCPDPSRLEAANIGVVLFCPALGYLRARIARDNDRVRHFFGQQDWRFIDEQKHGLAERLEVTREEFRTLDDFTTFIARRANKVRVTPPRFVKVVDPTHTLDDLFQKLVGERVARKAHARARTQLRQALQKRSLLRSIQRDIRIRLPGLGRTLHTPFAYRNGALNCIDAIALTGGDTDAAFMKVAPVALEGRELADLDAKSPRQLVMVLFEHEASREVMSTAIRILKAHQVKTYTQTSLRKLLDDIAEHATQARAASA